MWLQFSVHLHGLLFLVRIKIALAGIEPNCGVKSILQPLVSAELSSRNQIIKPLRLHSEVCLRGPVCLREEGAVLVGLHVEMRSVTSCPVSCTAPARWPVCAAVSHCFHVIGGTVWSNCMSRQSGVHKRAQACPGQPFAHFPLFVYVDPVNIITSQRLFPSCRKANTFERSHGLLATPVPGEKKRRPGQQERSGGLFGSCCATLTFLRRAVSLQTASHGAALLISLCRGGRYLTLTKCMNKRRSPRISTPLYQELPLPPQNRAA